MGSTSTNPILLVIDLQEGLVSPPPTEGARSTPNLASTVSQILKYWRRHHWPIIHINHDDPDPDHPLNRSLFPKTFAPHECAAPLDDEPMLYKHVGSAFVDPDLRLAERLQALGGPNAEVFVIGMDGAQCINDNTRSANHLGFKVTVVADACATFGMDDYRQKGKLIGPEETHTAAMSMLAGGFAKVVMAQDVLEGEVV